VILNVRRNGAMCIQRQALMIASLVLGLLLSGCDLTDRSTKPEVACLNNLRQIDGAEQAWALENHKSTNDTPTWDDLRTYFRALPLKCPAGGSYSLVRVSEPPRCSIPEHSALYLKNRLPPWSPGR